MKPLVLAALAALPCLAQTRGPLELSLQRAVELATSPEGNARIQIAMEGVKQAQARSAEARGALLPNVDASVSEQSMTRNLQAFGLRLNSPLPGFQIPEFVGPFKVFDVRGTASQSVFDFSAIRRFQASRAGVDSAKAEREAADDAVASLTAKAYVTALRTQAEVDAAEANVELAQAVLRQAERQKTAGTGTGIEVTRARVQLSNEQQRRLVAQNDRRRAHLELLRAMGMRLDTTLTLTDRLAYTPVDRATIEQAQKLALDTRHDLAAQQERAENARLAASATKLERLPSVAGFADYGSIGSSINHAIPTRTFGVAVKLPIFDGGRRDARRAESQSQLRTEKVRTADLREQIELEVRLALDAVESAEEQVKVAEGGLELAENELAQAQRRYEAGVASGLEVTDAQTRVARARDNRIAAVSGYNLARLELGQATGTIRQMLQ